MKQSKIFEIANTLTKDGKPFVIVTVVNATSGSPGKPGFKMIIDENGPIEGTVGGGNVEYNAINIAKKMINGEIKSHTYFETINLDKEASNSKSLCGGEISLYYELFAPDTRVYIFGAGHVGSKVSEIAVLSGFYSVLVDNRKAIIDKIPDYVYSEKILINFNEEFEKNLKNLNIPETSYILIMTHNHIYDYKVLKSIYTIYPNMFYVGLIASKSKAKDLVSKLKLELNLDDSKIKNLYTPVGIKIGGSSAGEIAVSIVAELIAIKYNKEVPHHSILIS